MLAREENWLMARKPENAQAPNKVKIDMAAANADTPFYYVNFLSINHSPYDITVGVAKMPAKISDEEKEKAKKQGALMIDPLLQLVMPPGVAKSLIAALEDQLKKYEEQF